MMWSEQVERVLRQCAASEGIGREEFRKTATRLERHLKNRIVKRTVKKTTKIAMIAITVVAALFYTSTHASVRAITRIGLVKVI